MAYKLDILNSLKIHPVFHVSILHLYQSPESIKHWPLHTPPPDPVTINDNDEFEVDKILDHRKHHNHQEYLVKWVGYLDYDASWYPATHLTPAPDCIADYWTLRWSLKGGGSDVMVLQTWPGGRGTVNMAQHMLTSDCSTVDAAQHVPAWDRGTADSTVVTHN